MVGMRRSVIAVATWVALAVTRPAVAHPAPFSYLDILVDDAALRITLIVHTFDLAHELNVEPPERVLELDVLRAKAPAFTTLLSERLKLLVDGAPATFGTWSAPEPMPERQSVRLETTIDLARIPGRVGIQAYLFPYDKVHQTFINVYERGQLKTQTILDVRRQHFEYFGSAPRGVLATLRTFLPDGVTHVLFGLDHLAFLGGLLLLGGSLRQRLTLVSAFVLTHTIALFLAAFNIVRPPARLVEPAIALSIVYVGADNLMVRGGRDVRGWIAAAFGAIHGLGYASVLRGLDLSQVALAWSVAAFTIGVALGQLVAVSAIATVVAALRSRDDVLGRRITYAGSVAVIAAGTFWFVRRVFFPGGVA